MAGLAHGQVGGVREEEARVLDRLDEAARGDGEVILAHEPLVEARRVAGRQHGREHLERGEVGVGRARDVVPGDDHGHLHLERERVAPRLRLRRLLDLRARRRRRPRDGPEVLLGELAHLGLVDVAHDDERGVVRLVVGVVELLAVLGRAFSRSSIVPMAVHA